MPEIRKDIVSGNWVIIATERAKRPETFTRKVTEKNVKKNGRNCPFCWGNEKMTPPEVLSIRQNNSGVDEPGWEVRVIPNKFPALEYTDEIETDKSGIFEFMTGGGVHEVIIETPHHELSPGELPVEQVKKIIDCYYERYHELEKDPNLAYIQIFRNHGREAGASIEHPHSQLIALPVLPPAVKREMDEARNYYFEQKECVYCKMLKEEFSKGERIIAHNEHFAAFIPYAAKLPFETWLLPRNHESSFSEMSEKERQGLAEILHTVLAKLWKQLNDPPYNYYLHSAPSRFNPLPDYHWHIEIIPKLTTAAGFELGAGMFINIANPEASAEFLRERH